MLDSPADENGARVEMGEFRPPEEDLHSERSNLSRMVLRNYLLHHILIFRMAIKT
jgi:hypothetical protein